MAARSGAARADAVAYSCQANVSDNIEPLTQAGACIGFAIKNSSGKVVKQVKFGFPTSGELLSTADGKTVVMVQSGLYASVNAEGVAVAYGNGKQVRDPVVVLVYRGDKKLAAYRFSQVVFRGRLVSQSVSHVQWLVRQNVADPPPLLDKTLTLNTTSFRTVAIDLETGKLDAQDSPLWKRCTVIAYGPVKRQGSGYRMDPAYFAKGKVAPHLDFSAPATVSLGSPGSYVTLCIEKQKGKLVATEVIDILLNALTAP